MSIKTYPAKAKFCLTGKHPFIDEVGFFPSLADAIRYYEQRFANETRSEFIHLHIVKHTTAYIEYQIWYTHKHELCGEGHVLFNYYDICRIAVKEDSNFLSTPKENKFYSEPRTTFMCPNCGLAHQCEVDNDLVIMCPYCMTMTNV